MELIEIDFQEMPRDVLLKVRESIKKTRLAKDITQRQLEQLSGIKQQYLSKIEAGQVIPNIKTLDKIARALRVDIKELL